MEIQSVTIRFPSDLVKQAKQIKEENKSFNFLISFALTSSLSLETSRRSHHPLMPLPSINLSLLSYFA
jgi:pterin-4a-carbinolamine dehydratase